MSAFWRTVAVVSVCVLFILAVLSSVQNITVGLVQSVLLLAIVVIGVRLFRGHREELLKAALISLGAGVALRILNNPSAQVASESFIALAITTVAVYVLGPPLVRLPIRLRSIAAATALILTRPSPTAAIDEGVSLGGPRRPLGALGEWAPFLIAAGIVIVTLLASSRRVVGAQSASLQWNLHLLTANLVREGARLIDAGIGLGTGSGTSVVIPDSLLLSFLKLLAPHAWAFFFGNLVTVFGIGLLVYTSVRFLQKLGFGRTESVAATILFLLLPVGLELHFAAPLDLSIPLLAILPVFSERVQPRFFLGVAFATGLCNTANGYEYAALLLALRAFGSIPITFSRTLSAWGAVLALAGSLIAGLLLHALAPAASLREAWWFAEEIPRIVFAENLPVWIWGILAFALLAAAGVYAMIRRRLAGLRFTVALFAAAALLAVPTRVGGIPLVSLADILRVIAPAGWPTARFLEVAAFSLIIPVAYTISVLLGSFAQQRRVSAAVGWLSAAILLALCFPRSVATAVPKVAAGTTVVEFPIAEAGSRAGVGYAEDLLTAQARIVQPLVFVNLPSSLALQSAPDDRATIKTMQQASVRLVVMRPDVYAKPAWRTVEPRLYDPAFSVSPSLAGVFPWKFVTYSPPVQGT